jgi:hypothetical protein
VAARGVDADEAQPRAQSPEHLVDEETRLGGWHRRRTRAMIEARLDAVEDVAVVVADLDAEVDVGAHEVDPHAGDGGAHGVAELSRLVAGGERMGADAPHMHAERAFPTHRRARQLDDAALQLAERALVTTRERHYAVELGQRREGVEGGLEDETAVRFAEAGVGQARTQALAEHTSFLAPLGIAARLRQSNEVDHHAIVPRGLGRVASAKARATARSPPPVSPLHPTPTSVPDAPEWGTMLKRVFAIDVLECVRWVSEVLQVEGTLLIALPLFHSQTTRKRGMITVIGMKVNRVSVRRMVTRTVLKLGFAILTATVLFTRHALGDPDEAKQLTAEIAKLRNVQPQKDEAQNAVINRRLDEAWKFLESHRAQALPALQTELQKALATDPIDQFFILDLANFLYRTDPKTNGDVALRALARLDPTATVIKANHQELFDFARLFSLHKERRALAAIDKLFLDSDAEIAVPQHAMGLNGTFVCVFLYGPFGADIDRHLVDVAKGNASRQKRVLGMMSIIGADAGLAFAADMLQGPALKDDEMFARAVGTLARLGGPKERKLLLSIDTRTLSETSRAYYLKIKPDITALSFDSLSASLVRDFGAQQLSDSEVRARLKKMLEHAGKDEDTKPNSIVAAKIPSSELIRQLREIRSSIFARLSNEALEDVEVGNRILAALAYRPF